MKQAWPDVIGGFYFLESIVGLKEQVDKLNKQTSVAALSDEVCDHMWKMYQQGQVSADHTAKEVFAQTLQSFADWLHSQHPAAPQQPAYRYIRPDEVCIVGRSHDGKSPGIDLPIFGDGAKDGKRLFIVALPAPQQHAQAPNLSCWLVESSASPIWWDGRFLSRGIDPRHFTNDPNKAVQFATKADAERITEQSSGLIATEHIWLAEHQVQHAQAALSDLAELPIYNFARVGQYRTEEFFSAADIRRLLARQQPAPAPVLPAAGGDAALALLRDAARAWNNERESELDATMERIEIFLIQHGNGKSSPAQGEALSAIEPDNVLLDFLDNNLKMTMGWRVGIAPAGNVSIQSIIASKTTIREAIHEAMAIKHASAIRALNKQEPTA